jgi:hypothetical protein
MQQCGVKFFRYFHFNSDAPTDRVLLWSSNQNIDWGFVLLSSSSLQQQAKHELGFFKKSISSLQQQAKHELGFFLKSISSLQQQAKH